MNTIRLIQSCMLAALLGHSTLGNAEDIDIYSGLGSSVNTPNVLLVLDNAANFSSSASGSSCIIDGVATALSGTVGGIEQCALYNVISGLPVNADGSARINIGVMLYNDNDIRDVSGNLKCGAPNATGGCLAQPLIPMDAANKPGILAWIKSWVTTGGAVTGQVKASGEATAAAMQEAWAYYRGSTGLSGRSYAAIQPDGGCQKNFVIFIGNSFSASGTPGDGDAVASALDNAPGVTADQKVLLTNTVTSSCGSYTFPTSAHESKGFYADEWARYMSQTDLYSTPDGSQGITTYTVGILGASCQAEYAATLSNMARYGGGKYFATTDYSSLVVAILKILNEVQAVNSVFSSSSLPVSVNAQGTYLNQIYMGMFRPDPGALPRWAGNLKQYAFILDPSSGALQLGDSIGNPALDSSGTGFLSPNAISYWSCARTDNPYYTGTLTAAQQTLLTANGQICATDPVSATDPTNGGFWINYSSMTNSAGKGFDLPDGELVEKGGASQQLRLANLANNYATSPATPRNLYTYCPSGSSCQAALTHADNAFATSNAAITATMFGGSSSVNISVLTRSGTTVTVTTTGNHGFASGDSITIANAIPSNYNGTFPITVTDATHFTYPVTEYPPTPAVGSYTASLPGPSKSVTLTRSGNTVTATSTAHGFTFPATVTISGADQTGYNGSFAILGTVTANTFQYTVTEQPALSASGGTATGEKQATGQCPAPCMVNSAIGTVTRPLGSTTVTVNTSANHSFLTTVGKVINLTGVVDGSGNAVDEYTDNVITTSWNNPTNNRSFTFTTTLSPATPATGTITASTSSSPVSITLTRTGSTAFATSSGNHGFTTGNSVIISGTPGANESAYAGTFTITVTDGTHFNYPVTTTPATPATGLGGATMTATRGGATPDRTSLINWIRGEDNYGDETGPGGTVTIRPSLHGDVLHSRPTVLNYGGGVIAITSTSDSGGTRTATASAADVAKIGAIGVTANIKFSGDFTCSAVVASTTTFTYPTSNCGAAGAQTVATDSANVIVFYGDNGGVYHAVNGNQTNPPGSTMPVPGSELWGFIPSEMLLKFERMRTNSPQLNLPSTPPGILPAPTKKDYFIDGPTGVYQLVDSNGTTLTAHLYLAMRRGGRLIYALDVTDPTAPRVLWEKDNTSTDMSELGQTWSHPKVAKVDGYCGGATCDAAHPPTPVLIFGAGYDTEEDVEPPLANLSGRGIFVLDALTGALVWKAGPSAGATSCTGTATQASCAVSGMNWSIPADITLVDRDLNGLIDRLYAADVGGNIWRVDLEPAGNSTPDYWRVNKLAALGCWSGPCSIPSTTTPRKFFYPPEVITTSTYDAVIAGTGDREHPLFVDTSTQRYNRVVLLKDMYPGNDATGMTPITFTGGEGKNLFDATSTSWDGSLYGYYITLGAGEKVVNAPLVTAGYVFFGTNQPTAPSANSCTSSLGVAKGYRLQPFAGQYASVNFSGGGLPPSPVSGVVNIKQADGTYIQTPFLIGGGNPDCVGSDCASALGGQKPPISVSTRRTRTYWYQQDK